jgi:hypothetical protein
MSYRPRRRPAYVGWLLLAGVISAVVGVNVGDAIWAHHAGLIAPGVTGVGVALFDIAWGDRRRS